MRNRSRRRGNSLRPHSPLESPRYSEILDLQGLAQNLKDLGHGKVWIVGTAQQTLTEDDPRAAINSPELYKLKDRFPIPVALEVQRHQGNLFPSLARQILGRRRGTRRPVRPPRAGAASAHQTGGRQDTMTPASTASRSQTSILSCRRISTFCCTCSAPWRSRRAASAFGRRSRSFRTSSSRAPVR